jgi:hypothetical protein
MTLPGFPRGLDEFTYGDTEMTDLISSSVDGLEFQGLNGPIRWKEDNSPIVDHFMQQQWGERRKWSGLWFTKRTIEWSNE